MTNGEVYDMIIIGAGPAGLAAGLYAARDRRRTLLLEKNGLPGGQIMLTEKIENYPGYEQVGGFELVEHMKAQVLSFGAQIAVNQAVDALRRLDDGLIEVSVDGGENLYTARAVLLAPGSDYRKLSLPGEEELRQATRVSYCATCDGAFYRDKHVLAIGGGNTALEDAVYLATRFTRKLTLIHRRREFRAQKILVEELYAAAKENDIDVKLPYVPVAFVPTDDKENDIDVKLPYVPVAFVPTDDGADIDHVKIRNVETDEIEELKVDGVFIFVGMDPNTAFARDAVQMDDAGNIAADPITMRTSTPGIWVAGDCRQNAPLQLATACADGVTAAMNVRDYLRNPDAW